MTNNSNQPRPYDAVLGGQSPPPNIWELLEQIEALRQKPSWTMLYAHNYDGEKTSGELNLLINAIRNGHQVRIVIKHQDGDYEYATYAENLWIRNSIVFAQNTSAVSSSFSGNRLRFHEDCCHWLIIVNTKGEMEMSRWNLGEHKKREEAICQKVAVMWFADVS